MGMTERIARACAAHPGRTFAAWGVVLAASIAAIVTLMSGLTTDATVTGNPESRQAERLLVRGFPPDPKRTVTDVIVVRSEELTVADAEFRRVVDQLERDARNSGALVSGRTYYGTGDATLVSQDRHATLIPVFVVGEDRIDDLLAILESAEASGPFTATITGNHTADNDFNALSEKDLREGELQFGLPAALVILVLVFGALVAALIPVLMAIVSIVVALGLVAVLSQQFELSIFIVNMLTGMGLALGIDYSLFVISRYREERSNGRDPDAAIHAAGATASRAVLFSGSAFVVALLGMLIVPTTIMRSLAAGAILVGVVSVAAALTLLPALLGSLHDRVDSLRIPLVGRGGAEGRFWGAVIDRVLRRPGLSLAVAATALLAAAVPALGLSIGASGVSTLPDELASRRGHEALQRDFPTAGTDPVQIVAEERPDTVGRFQDLFAAVQDDPRFGPADRQESNGVVMLVLPVRGDEVSDEAVAAVRDLRDRIVPETFAGSPTEAYVGGTTSENIDYFDAVTDPAPLVFAFVLGLTLILLTVAFRSIAVALSAIALNLLSVGAAYGLLVLVFQHGVGADLLGFTQVDSIDAWVPLFLFSVLFGLSMDYQVFLLSRIRERYDRTRDTRDAIRWGVASTARIITGAALIIVAVFSGFARGDLVMFQQMGFGVAVALLIDATLIRSVVLPSAMTLLGDRNWYLPGWLEWIPHLEVEGHTARESNTAPSTSKGVR
jgi:RND superfamily putative drug exporter